MALCLAGCAGNNSQQTIEEQGFTSLFNGTDFTGWKLTDVAREHWSVKDGVLDFDGVKGDGCGDGAQFLCPEQAPCKGITLHDVKVDGGKMKCENAYGSADDTDPASCLKGGK